MSLSKNHPGCPYPVGDCACPMSEIGVLDAVTDRVLAYRPKPKTKAAKKRARRKKRKKKRD